MLNACILSLAWFAVVNAAASALAWIAARAIPESAVRRPGLLLFIRLFPAAASIAFVAAVFAPAHWRFEPRGVQETFGLAVHALAFAGLAILGHAALRAAAAIRSSARLRAGALARADGIEAGGAGVYVAHGLAGVSLAGVFRPRILLSPDVRETLSAEELDLAVAHELAHRAALDNAKRFAMLCAPDVFGRSAAARRIEARWRAAAECQADARAAGGNESRAMHLASALVKVARLGATRTDWVRAAAWSTLHDPPLLETRVRRLVGGQAHPVPGPSRILRAAIAAACAAGIPVAGALVAAHLHQLTEILAHILP